MFSELNLAARVAYGRSYRVRPFVRGKFPNFSFLRVSEMFGFQSSDFFSEKPELAGP